MLMSWELAGRKEKASEQGAHGRRRLQAKEDVSQRRSNTQQRDSTARTAAAVQRASCMGDNNSTVGSSLREALAESSEVTRGTAFSPRQGKHPPFTYKTHVASSLESATYNCESVAFD